MNNTTTDNNKKTLIVLSYTKPPIRLFSRTHFTQDEFVVNGVNLAQYGFEETAEPSSEQRQQTMHLSQYYELFEDFSIQQQVSSGHSYHWNRLNRIRHNLADRPSLSFYADKVASKRTLAARGIPQVQHVVRYRHELLSTIAAAAAADEILQTLIPQNKSYVAKSSHLCSSFGVHVVKYNATTKQHSLLFSKKVNDGEVGNNDQRKKKDYNATEVAYSLWANLQAKPHERESYAIRQVQPGLVIEDRFTSLGGGMDTVPAAEFNVFTVWGKVLLAHYKTGDDLRLGLFDRQGQVIDWKEEKKTELPDWVDWSKVVALAETMGAHKDLLRVDIFVGVPADAPILHNDAAKAQQREAVQVVVNEVAFHSTLKLPKFARDEMSRLWLAGYKMGIYRYVPNSEVPPAFVQKGHLSEEDLAEWMLHRNGDQLREPLA